jgi:exodeoxyribonuclease V alpha subunit
MSATATVSGELASWRQHGASGWGVGKVRGADGTLTSIVGVIVGAREGDAIEVSGAVKTDPKWGDQIAVATVKLSPPTSVDGAIAWLVATLPNVGEKRARALVEWCGGVDKLWACIEHTPRRLALVDGISDARADEIHTAYVAARADREHQVTLRGWGLTTSQIGRCMSEWLTAEHAVERIRADPYELFRKVHGFGWTRADVVARKSGVPHDAPRRIAAGIEHVLGEHAIEGHVCMRPRVFQAEVERVLGVGRDAVMAGIRHAVGSGVIVKRALRIYSSKLDRLEARVAELIVQRVGEGP